MFDKAFFDILLLCLIGQTDFPIYPVRYNNVAIAGVEQSLAKKQSAAFQGTIALWLFQLSIDPREPTP